MLEGATACVANIGDVTMVRRTQLRVSVTDPRWDDPVPIKSLGRKDPATARWMAILKSRPCEEAIGIGKEPQGLRDRAAGWTSSLSQTTA
jgi:hypothetical protein